jgi:hypothetical protein
MKLDEAIPMSETTTPFIEMHGPILQNHEHNDYVTPHHKMMGC